jgi:hypothetical protein
MGVMAITDRLFELAYRERKQGEDDRPGGGDNEDD